MNKFNDIGKDPEIKKLLSDQRIFLKKNRDENNTWNEVRDDKNFSLNEKKFPWGTRKIYTPNETKNNYLLQRSRGIDLELDDTNDEMIEKLKKSIGEINEIDKIRILQITISLWDYPLTTFCRIIISYSSSITSSTRRCSCSTDRVLITTITGRHVCVSVCSCCAFICGMVQTINEISLLKFDN